MFGGEISFVGKCENSPVLCLLQNTNIIFVDLRAQLGPKLALLCERGVSAGGVLELRGIFASSSSWL